MYKTTIPLILAVCFFSILSSCENSNEENSNVPILTTTEISQITDSSAVSGGIILDDKGSTVITKGVCWSLMENPTIMDSKTEDGTGASSYISSITNLQSEKTYFYKAYATNDFGTGYGNAMSFTTKKTFKIGDDFGGGKIAYIYRPGDEDYEPGKPSGIVVSLQDQSTYSTFQQARIICSDLEIEGIKGWVIPNFFEWSKICANKDKINVTFSHYPYWIDYVTFSTSNGLYYYHTYEIRYCSLVSIGTNTNQYKYLRAVRRNVEFI